MKWGPVLSNTYDLMKAASPSASGLGCRWMQHMASDSYYVNLIQLPPITLSAADADLAREIYNAYGDHDPWELSELTHRFPEWRNPGPSSRPISLDDILRALGKGDEEREEILSLQRTDSLLAAYSRNAG